MGKTKSKWITFGTSVIFRRESINALILEDNKIKFFIDSYGSEWLNKKDYGEDEWERIKDDYYKYKAKVDKLNNE